MIDFITGILVYKKPSKAVVDVNGVGYSFIIPISTFDELGQPGEQVTLLTHLVHRDDAMELYGFATELERELFDSLISVSGIGPRMAVKILSGMPAPQLAGAICTRDFKMLTSIPGVGRKKAEKLCIELEGTIANIHITEGVIPESAAVSDAIDALVALGFSQRDAAEVIRKAKRDVGDVPAEDLIRVALALLRNNE